MKLKLFSIFFLLSSFLTSTIVFSSEVSPLLSKLIPESSEKEVQILKVTLLPGENSPIHKHDAQTFVYVLSGKIAMAVNNQDPTILEPGDTFYESPNDIHTITRNLDNDKKAVMLVFFIKEPGAPSLKPVK